MIYSAPQGGLEQLAFKHPLVQEVAYASLVSERKKSLHRGAAKALSSYFSKELNEHAALIARHWEEGGEPMQAAAFYMTSAAWMGTRDPVQAVRTWKHVRELTSNLPVEGPRAFIRMMTCGQIINLSWPGTRHRNYLNPSMRKRPASAGQLKDARAGALVTMAYGRALLASGSPADDYLRCVKKAQEMLSETPNSSVAALLLAVESHSTGQAGFLKKALQLNTRALESVSDVEVADQRMIGFDVKQWLIALRSRYLVQTGDPLGAEHLIDELLRDTSRLDLTHRAVALGVRVDAAALNRDATRALEAASELESIANQNSSPYVSVLTNYFRGIALLVACENEKAHERLSKALEQAYHDRTGLELESTLANLSDTLGRDQAQAAIEMVEQAQALARRRSQRVAELFALSTKIRILNRASLVVEPALTKELDRLVSVTGAERLRLRTLPAC